MVRHSLSNDSRRAWGLGWGTYAWLLAALLCSGCTVGPNTVGPITVAPITVAPIEETRLFLKAFVAVDEASRTLFNDFAIAERRQGKLNAETKAKRDLYQGACKGIIWAMVDKTSGYIAGFCVEDAPYFSELGDPPATEVLRHVIRLIGDYVELLLTLAEGRNLADTSAHIQAFAQNIFALTSVASGPGAAAGPTSVLGALEPIIRDAAQQKNIEEMKRLVLSGAPLLKKLIETLRGATAEVFNTFIFNSERGATSPEARDDKRVAETFILRIDAYRTAMSNYVTLLKELELSADQLMTAFVQPRSAVSIAAFAQRSGELLARAEAWRRAYSNLGAGGY